MSLHSKETVEHRLGGSSPGSEDAEVALWNGSFSSMSMVGSWLMAIVISVLVLAIIVVVKELRMNEMVWLFGIGVIVLLWGGLACYAVYRKLAQYFELTTHRLKHRDGILFRVQSRMELIDVDDVLFRQGPIQTLLGVGDIIVVTSDKTHPQLVLRGIAQVAMVVDLIDDARRKERRRRGLHVNN